MNTAKLKTFAQQSRRILISGVEQRMLYWGFDEKGKVFEEPKAVAGGIIHRGVIIDDPHALQMWKSLKNAVLKNGYNHIVEEASYTWFNRIMALKILAENGYEQPQVDYGDDGLETPEILRKSRAGNYTFLDKNSSERLKLILNDYDQEYNAFAILLEGYCQNNSVIRRVFGLLNDFTGLLIPSNILDKNGFIHLLNTGDSITEEDYRKVELIGWLYQFYISEKKDEVFGKLSKNQKAEPEDIPAATQIFTPNWIVKYMVQNTVGQIWLDHKPDSTIRSKMKFFVENCEWPKSTGQQLISEVTQIKLLDPASGSGHILVEGFDLLYEMYLEEYYSSSEAVESILKYNIFGLDIDLRAVQLARFAVLLKAASKYPDILKKEILPEIYSMPEPDIFNRQEIVDFLGEDGKESILQLQNSLKLMQESQNLGSIMIFEITQDIRKLIFQRLDYLKKKTFKTTSEEVLLSKIQPFLDILGVMTQKYESVVTNPPYMGSGNLNNDLKAYIDKHYSNSKSDLFAVFMEVCLNQTCHAGRMGMINQQSWMFLASFEKLRKELLNNYSISSMLHLGTRTFDEISGEVVQSTAFILVSQNPMPKTFGNYYRLTEYRNSIEKEKHFLEKTDQFEFIPQQKFSKIPGSPIAYWISEKFSKAFKNILIKEIFDPKKGLVTMGDELFIRYWYEVDFSKIGFKCQNASEFVDKGYKWCPYKNGGGFRRWFGNRNSVINWENDGDKLKKYITKKSGDHYSRQIFNQDKYFLESISWNSISSSKSSFRFYEKGFIFGSAGPSIFSKDQLKYGLGLLNSKLTDDFIKIINPTFNFGPTVIGNIPYVSQKQELVNTLVDSCIKISMKDWNSDEISFDFMSNILIGNGSTVEKAYEKWYSDFKGDFFKLHENEEELNKILIESYNLSDELSPNVDLENITILQDGLDKNILVKLGLDFKQKGKDKIELPVKRDFIIGQLISYSIGCIMGRYRLDKPGLNVAHRDFRPEEISNYKVTTPLLNGARKVIFSIDDDGLIPLMADRGYFSDDVIIRFKHFVEIVWGNETLTENINFLEECLGKDIESFFIKDFWIDHVRRYKKRPIFWLFSSSNGAFQILAYMHRMNKFTAEKVRNNYLLKHIQFLKGQINLLEPRQADLSKLEAKKLDKFRVFLAECEEYDMLLKDVADKQIEFDLDDGVKVNYAKYGKVLAEIK